MIFDYLRRYLNIFVFVLILSMIIGHIVNPQIPFVTHFFFSACIVSGIVVLDAIILIIKEYVIKRKE